MVLLVLCQFGVAAQSKPIEGPLLLNENIQIESTVAVNALYNFEFKKADKEFKWMKYKYPKHPMPFFLLGFSAWWKTVPAENSNREQDKVIIGYLDSCIYFCEELLDKDEKDIDAIFFLSASYGFLARIYSDQKSYRKATFAGKNALKYLEKGKEYLDLSPEFLFGDGLINYYLEWIKENYKFLRPVLFFFPNGDKELGIKQLEEAGRNAFYTRTEAQYWIMYIYAREEVDYKKAFPVSQYLYQTFPNNAYFARYYAQLCWSSARYDESEKASLAILKGIEEGKVGYEEVGGRYASFYLAFINRAIKRDIPESKKYYKKCIDFAEKVKAFDSGYYKFSHIYLARFAMKEEDEENAKKYYRKYMKIEKNRKDPKYREAKEYLKKHTTKKEKK